MIKLNDDIYYVGCEDYNLRCFHGYSTLKGVTYNAYLIIDEKITLIDTVKSTFKEELLENISKIIDPSKIDYIIANHVEMDHSSSIPYIMKYAKNATILSNKMGVLGLKKHYGEEYNYQILDSELNIGVRTLKFITTPMLHWPDNMFTYSEYDKILFSNDAFGQHYATSMKFDYETSSLDYIYEAKKYYANILMPYGNQIKKAINSISDLQIDMIAPSHGIIFKKDINKIIELYKDWSSNENRCETVIVYDSMWSSTETMANTILKSFKDKNISTKLYDLKNNHISDIMTDVLSAKYLIVGSPTLNNNMLPNVSSFLTYLRGLNVKEKLFGFSFGSYGWSGESVKQVENELKNAGVNILLSDVKYNYVPTEDDLNTLYNKINEVIN